MEASNAVTPVMPPAQPWRRLSRRLLNMPELGVSAALIVFFFLFSGADKNMATPAGLALLFTQVTYMGFAAIGMSCLMLAGEIDLSTGAVAGLAAAVAATLIGNLGWPEWAGLSAAILAAVLVGLLNSVVVLRIGVPSFFGTLGTHFVVLGIMQAILRGEWILIEDKVPTLSTIASPSPFFGVPWSFVMFVALVVIGDLLLRRSRLGPILSATGANRRAADIAGINTTRVKTLGFIFVSICSALGGLLVMNAGIAADPQIGDSWQLWIIAIAVIGGSSFSGGLGSISGAFLGALLIQVIKLGLSAAQIKTNAQGVVVGTILVVSAILDVLRRRAKQY